jgi:hypothetical protein
MQKIIKAIVLFTTIIFIAGSSCKKYPDGPLINFHSKELRVLGTWDVEYYSINGYDSTSYLKAQPYYGKYTFHAPKGDNPGGFDLLSNNNIYATIGNWEFGNNKENLNIEQVIACTSLPQFETNPYIAHYITWEIRRLTDSDIWLKTTFYGKEYFMKLKQV